MCIWREAPVIPTACLRPAAPRPQLTVEACPSPVRWVAVRADTTMFGFKAVSYSAVLWRLVTDTALRAEFSLQASWV